MHKFRQTSGPQYFGSAQKKSLLETNNIHPGPGSHSPKQPSKLAAPEWKMGLSTDRHSFLDPHRATIPSPQHYQVSHHEVEKLSKKMSFPLYSPIDKPNSDNLKNCYDATIDLTKTALPLFSFGYSRDPDYSTLAPGPGTYDLPKPKTSFNKTQSGFSIGQRPAPYGDEVKVPSPNKYNPNSTIKSPKYSFSKAARSQPVLNDAPGRFYDLEPKKTTIKLGRGHSTEYKREVTFLGANQGPAPNAYHADIRNKIPGGTFEASKRTSIENPAICEFPSSDKYLIHKDFDLNRGKSFIKDDRHLNATSDGVPGPGSYLLMSTLSRIGASLSKKPNKKEGEQEVRLDFPGPAAYHPKDSITRRKGGSTIVLRATRQDFSKSLTKEVGPGTYDIAGCFDRELGKIGKSMRRPLDLPNNNPGVGMYDIHAQIGHQQKRSVLSEANSVKTNKQKLSKALKKGQESAHKSELDSSMQQGHNPEMTERVSLQQQVNYI